MILSNVIEASEIRGRVETPEAPQKRAVEAPVRRKEHRFTLSPERKGSQGRKSALLDKPKLKRLCDALLAGNTTQIACALAGLGETTFYRWMKEAEDAPKGHPLRQFRESIKRAIAEARHRNMMIIQKAAPKDWRAAAWFLERSDPKNWGRRRYMQVGGDADAPPIPKAEIPDKELSQEERLTVVRNMLKRLDGKRT